MNVRYFKVGAPCRGERVAKLNRLLQIEAELSEECCLSQWEAQTFPFIKPPTPPPTPEASPDAADAEKKSEKDSKKK